MSTQIVMLTHVKVETVIGFLTFIRLINKHLRV